MKKLHTFSPYEQPQAAMLKQLLADEGVQCLLRNEQLLSASGEIPIMECSPELWVIDDEVYPRARLLIDGWLNQDLSEGPPWLCPDCGEQCESQFGACWSCGRLRD